MTETTNFDLVVVGSLQVYATRAPNDSIQAKRDHIDQLGKVCSLW